MRWLDVPLTYLVALLRRIPQLQAEESLRRTSEVALGAGTAAKEDQQRLRSAWQREAAGSEHIRRPQSSTDFRAAAQAMGITVVQEPA